MADTLLKRPDGKFVTVSDPVEVASALADGYVPATREQFEASKQEGRAFAEGAARGASFGLSDPFQVGFGVKPAELQARREENPVASMTGEVAGAIGTSVLTGGGASALAGGGIKGAAFEGGLYGMGSMISEAALENKELATDSLAAGFVGGALASGGVAAGFQGLKATVSLGASKFGGQGLKDTALKAADELEWRSLSESNSRWAKQNAPFKDEILKFGREKGILSTARTALDDATAQKAQSVASSYATKIAGQMDDLERMVPLKGNDQLRMGLVNHLEKVLDDEFGRNPVFAESLNGAKKLTDAIAQETTHTWPTVWEIQSSLFKDVPVTGLSPASTQVRETLRKAMRDYVFDTVAAGAQMPAGLSASMRKTGQESRAAMALSKALSTRAQSIESSGGVMGLGSLKSLGVGAMTGFATGNPLAAAAGAVAETQIRKRGGMLGATALRSIADSRVTANVSKALSSHLGKVLSVAPEFLGAYRYPLATAAAQGADALLQEHIRLASGPEGQDYLARVALPVESGDEVTAAGARLAALDAVDKHAQDTAAQLDAGVAGLFGAAPGRKGSVATPMTKKEYEKARASMEAMIRDPVAAFEQVPQDLSVSAPEATGTATQKVLAAVQFLYSKAPKNPYAGMPPAVAPKWEPDAVSLDRFSRYKEAVESPARVLKNMANGYIAPEQVEALKAVYPAMYADLQQKISERLMMLKKPLSYQQRLAVTAIIGPGALGMSPQQVQVLQQSQALASGQNSGQGKPMKGPDGRQDVNEEQLQTEAQKLENR